MPPAKPREYFLSSEYLDMPSVEDNELNEFLDSDFVGDLCSICFPKKFFKTCLDAGCGKGYWVEALQSLDYDVTGVDHYPPDKPGFIAADLLTWKADRQYDFAVCLEVVMYMTRSEIKDSFLPVFFSNFSKAAFLYCPDPSIDAFADPNHVTLPSTHWLRSACESAGGHAFIMYFTSEILGSSYGPCILWVKDVSSLGISAGEYAHLCALKYRELEYHQFVIGV